MLRTTDRKGDQRLARPPAFVEAELEAAPQAAAAARPARRLLRRHRPDHGAAAAHRALGDAPSAGPSKGGVGLFAQEPDPRRDRPSVRQPGPRSRARPPLLGGRRVQAAPLHHPRRHRLLQGRCRTWSARPTRPITDADGKIRPLIYDNGGTGRVYGLELVARHDFSQQLHAAGSPTRCRAPSAATRARRKTGCSTSTRPTSSPSSAATCCRATGRSAAASAWSAATRSRRSSGSVYNASIDRYDPIYGGVELGPAAVSSTSWTCGSTSAGSTRAGC